MDGIYSVLSGAIAQELRLEVITNNLANVNTSGFKKDRPIFSAVQEAVSTEPITPETGVVAPPAFSVLDRIVTDFSTGAFRTTGEPLDIAIEGKGFFAIETPAGVRYTRSGRFTLNEEQQIVNQMGYPVLGTGGAITLPPGTISVDARGRISVRGTESAAQPIEVDSLKIVTFSEQSALTKVGGSLFEAPAGSAVETPTVQVRQGAYEGSNVNVIEEMVAMIEVVRLYQAAQKAIQAADETAARAANEVGRAA